MVDGLASTDFKGRRIHLDGVEQPRSVWLGQDPATNGWLICLTDRQGGERAFALSPEAMTALLRLHDVESRHPARGDAVDWSVYLGSIGVEVEEAAMRRSLFGQPDCTPHPDDAAPAPPLLLEDEVRTLEDFLADPETIDAPTAAVALNTIREAVGVARRGDAGRGGRPPLGGDRP